VVAPAWAAGGAAPTRSFTVATPSACAVRPGPSSYPWPVAPFEKAHPVRGNFGDPRTIFGSDGKGHFSFHNGVDIAADDGTPVYPVVSGVVVERDPDLLIVQSADGRRFQYYHLVAAVRKGEHVVQSTTLLGVVRRGAHHVHLTEIRDAIVQNPLAPGHLTPYSDSLPPVVDAVSFLDADGATIQPDALKGLVDVIADAYDRPSLPVPGIWHDLPVAPAALAWQVDSLDGRTVIPERVTIDFRASEPDDPRFWNVYVRGTMQNFAVVGKRYLYGHPGTYLYDVTPQPLDTRELDAGTYILTVTALDVCGNAGSLHVPIRVLPQAKPLPVPELPRQPEPLTWPLRLSAYTVVLASSKHEEKALVVAERARAAGLRYTGTLRSKDFTTLRPGYWLTFSGAYRTLAQAQRAAVAAMLRFPRATVRQLVPRIRLTRWPLERSGFTIVLASLPVAGGLDAARAEAKRAAAAGLRHVGVLVSSHFRNLNPGYDVVFCGIYATEQQAEAALGRAAAVYPAAYLRAVTP
jgi:hypothetical protein